MAIEVTIPRLGWSMDEGTFGEWLKADGDFVDAGDPIFTMESEKALQEVESVDSGILRLVPNAPDEGDIVTVGTLVAFLLEEGESMPDAGSAGSAVPAEESIATNVAVDADASEKSPVETPSRAAVATLSSEAALNAGSHRKGNGAPTISPRAKRLATQNGIDWTTLSGTGKTGRIRERDVADALAGQGRSLAASSRRRASSIRKTIANRMQASLAATAPVTLTTRFDATNLVSLRNQFKQTQPDNVPAFHDIIGKLTALALVQHPYMLDQWRDGEIVSPGAVDIGIAVDTPTGLLVPVVSDCDSKSLLEFSTTSKAAIERARNQSCTPEELKGGTFSISNLGAFGIDGFTPIINHPQSAILGLGAIRKKATVLSDGRIEARDQMTLSLTFDHQVIDGAPAAAFLQSLVSQLENPAAILIG